MIHDVNLWHGIPSLSAARTRPIHACAKQDGESQHVRCSCYTRPRWHRPPVIQNIRRNKNSPIN